MLDWLAEQGEVLDACIVGEPTNPKHLGEMIKVGRRGSISGRLRVHGTQGHVAYPHLADNPLHRLVRMLAALTAECLDQGKAHFQPSTLAITTIDVGNQAPNVIPAKASASFNIRFNDEHTSESLKTGYAATWLAAAALRAGLSGQRRSFPDPARAVDRDGVATPCSGDGVAPELSTTGGTSDARFIKNFLPVVEFGIVGQTMHKVDERACIADIEALTEIYRRILDTWFEAPC